MRNVTRLCTHLIIAILAIITVNSCSNVEEDTEPGIISVIDGKCRYESKNDDYTVDIPESWSILVEYNPEAVALKYLTDKYVTTAYIIAYPTDDESHSVQKHAEIFFNSMFKYDYHDIKNFSEGDSAIKP